MTTKMFWDGMAVVIKDFYCQPGRLTEPDRGGRA